MKSLILIFFILLLLPLQVYSQNNDLFLANGKSISASTSLFLFSDTSIIDNSNIINLQIFADVNYNVFFKDYHAMLFKPSLFLPISFQSNSSISFRIVSLQIGYDYYLLNQSNSNSAYSIGAGLGPSLYINSMFDIENNKVVNASLKLDSYIKASYYSIIKDSNYGINLSAQLFIGNIIDNDNYFTNMNLSTVISLGYTYFISKKNSINI